MPTMQQLIDNPKRIDELRQSQPTNPDALYERQPDGVYLPTQRYYDLFSEGVETHPITSPRVRRS